MNTKAEYAKLIEHSLLARRIFKVQKQLEETPEGMDWKKLFTILLKEVAPHTGSGSSGDEQWANQFISEFNAIEMADTIYPDVAAGLKQLVSHAGGVVVWSMGDVINSNQKTKIEKAGILDILRKHSGSARIESIIATDKFAPLPNVLNTFWQQNGQPSTLLVAAYEDSVKQFVKLKPVLQQWSFSKGVVIEPFYIRARCGHQADTPLPNDFDLPHAQAHSLTEAVQVLANKVVELKLSPRQVLVLLDFDGALSDNCLMRVRQAKVVFTYMIKAVGNLDRQYYGIPEGIF